MTKLFSSRFVGWGLALLAVVFWLAVDWFVGLPAGARAKYVGRNTCAECHETQHSLWTGSHHDRAMELATDESVLGDFDNAEFTHFGVTTVFFRRDKDFFVHTEGSDGQWRDYQIRYTFGIDPLQQYMVEFPDGRVQVLRISWDTVRGRWFYVSVPDAVDERIEAGSPMHWTGISQNWNTMCAECHSTNLHKNFDLAKNSYDTTYSEIDVSCEACHGPGSLHVELAEARSPFWDRHRGYALARLKGANPQTQLEACAPCHSRRSATHAEYHAGEQFDDHYKLSLLSPGLYHVDGQILDEVYVYGSFLQSKMHSEGVRCTDCHNPHSLELRFEGNQLCTQCHQPGKYDTPGHHHHTEVAATQCVACHMPQRNYMVIDARHDHSFRVPRPDLSALLGTPNACNACHREPSETPAWAAAAVREWYGEKRPDDPHYGVALAAARAGDPLGVEKIRVLLKRKKTPAIVRASALELLQRYRNQDSNRVCRDALGDPHALVRAAAINALSDAAVRAQILQVARCLEDSSRLVRSAAARRLVGVAPQVGKLGYSDALDRSIQEFREGLEILFDRAGSHILLSDLDELEGDKPAARDSLRTAIRLEPYLTGPRTKLALLLSSSEEDQQECRRLREEEIELLVRDSKLLPEAATPHYRRGMLLYLLGSVEQARKAFQEACQLEPRDYGNWLALALVCEKLQQPEAAIEALKKMEELQPGSADVRGILQRMRRAAGEGAEK